eukprot:scaffold2045_cov404-Prasinococcus_capsulatus_cf.AAC.72
MYKRSEQCEAKHSVRIQPRVRLCRLLSRGFGWPLGAESALRNELPSAGHRQPEASRHVIGVNVLCSRHELGQLERYLREQRLCLEGVLIPCQHFGGRGASGPCSRRCRCRRTPMPAAATASAPPNAKRPVSTHSAQTVQQGGHDGGVRQLPASAPWPRKQEGRRGRCKQQPWRRGRCCTRVPRAGPSPPPVWRRKFRLGNALDMTWSARMPESGRWLRTTSCCHDDHDDDAR